MISKISFSTSTPTLFPLYHHYKLTPVSTSTNLFPHHIAIHPPNSISFPLIGLHNAKQSAPHPRPPTCTYTASRSSPPSSVQSIYMHVSTLNSAQFRQYTPNPLTPYVYTSCFTLTLYLFSILTIGILCTVTMATDSTAVQGKALIIFILIW